MFKVIEIGIVCLLLVSGVALGQDAAELDRIAQNAEDVAREVRPFGEKVESPEERIRYWQTVIKGAEQSIRQWKAEGSTEIDPSIKKMRLIIKAGERRIKTQRGIKSTGNRTDAKAVREMEMSIQSSEEVIQRCEESIAKWKLEGVPKTDPHVQQLRQLIKTEEGNIKKRRALMRTDVREVREFQRRVLAIETVLGIPIFSRVIINGHILQLWLRDGSFISPNFSVFADLGDALAQLCSCETETYVSIDLTHLSPGATYPVVSFVFDPQTKRSVMR